MLGLVTTVNTVAGIGWEPEIRGALVVLVGSVVLFGSVWLILTTNLGSRLGTLNALAGFFGWMAIMGAVWWIYGIGLQGDTPEWVPKNIVYGELSQAGGDVGDLGSISIVGAPALVDQYCPGLVDATVAAQRARFLSEDPNIELDYAAPQPYCSESVGEKLAVDAETIADELTAANALLVADAEESGIDDARIQTPEELQASIAQEISDETTKLNQLSLSDLAAVSPDIIEQAEDDGVLDFRGWNLQSSGEAGEAIASADAELVGNDDVAFESSGEFLVVNAFQQGGKPKRASDGVWDRLWNEVRNTVVFWHPTNTAVITVAPTIEKEAIPGQAPPFAEIDPDGQMVSVVLERDLGSLRLPAAITTIGSLIAFLGLCWMLHTRDLELRRRVDEWDPAAAT